MSRLVFERTTDFAFGCPTSGSTETLTTGATAVGVDLGWPCVFRAYTTADAYVCVGVSGSCDASATNSLYLESGTVEYWSTLSGSTWFSALQVSSAGTVYLTPMSSSTGWVR